MEEELEVIKGLNREKEILTHALTHVSHNQSIQISSRLGEIDIEINKVLTP